MSEIETKPAIELSPDIPIYNLGQIADALEASKQVVIYRNADVETPYAVECVASIPPDNSGHLRLWGQAVVAAAHMPSYFHAARKNFQNNVRKLDVESLGATLQYHRSDQQHLRLSVDKLTGRERSLTAFFPKQNSPIQQFAISNNYSFARNNNVTSKSLPYERPKLEEDLQRYLGIFSLLERGFSGGDTPDYAVNLLEIRDQAHPRQKNRGPSSSKNKSNEERDLEYKAKEIKKVGATEEEAELQLPNPNVRLGDVRGVNQRDMHSIRKRIRVMSNPELAEHYGVASSGGILVEGGPGVGKTMLATGIANEVDGKIVVMNGEDIIDKYVGNSAKLTAERFDRYINLSKNQNVVLVINEIDAVIGVQTDRNEERNAALGVAKKKIEFIAENVPGLLIVGTTNNKDLLDKAFMRKGRFDIHIYMPLPDNDTREQILMDYITQPSDVIYPGDIVDAQPDEEPIFSSDMADYNIPSLVKATDGMSGAEIKAIFKECRLSAFFEHDQKDKYPGPKTGKDLLDEISAFREQSHE